MDIAKDLIAQYGYFAIYGMLALGMIGLPVPDEILMTFVGYLTSTSVLNFKLAVLVSFLGAITGMMGSFFLGRKLGKPLLTNHGKWIKLTPARLAMAERWFERYGPWTIVIGYYIPGIRHLTCYFSGISGMRKRQYFLYAGVGSLSWCIVFNLIGYYIGVIT
ncbi:DedA family protein [Peribacillus sp. FSL H8-0477]|uniref:DedA family protein n=1 Tax=Peribacillus sp. FSL H8-0477 TaxID=2921388 RepID=UPI0030F6FA7E